jgi:hypothetical protein
MWDMYINVLFWNLIGEGEECHKTSDRRTGLQTEVGTGCCYVAFAEYYVLPAEHGVQVRSKDSQVKTQLVLWIFIYLM